MISEVIPVFSRKPIFGYEFIAGSTVAIAFLSFGVWAHHMFAAGLGHTSDVFFSIGSMLIAIPTGVKVFNWIATMWGGSIRFTTAMCFATAFIVQFVIGGLSGITFAVAPIDWQMTDSYYVVAHFHYVAFGGIVFGIFAAVYYWFPKITGRMLSEKLGRAHFWLMVLGFNMTFFVQHFLGFLGMPRRVFTYPDLPNWATLNQISTVGAFLMAIASLLFVINIAKSTRAGEVAGDNPWKAWTLEWATTSPPPHDNFSEVPPITGRRPLWDLEQPKSKKTESKKKAEPEKTYDEGAVAMWCFIASEAGFFLILIISYVFYNAYAPKGVGPSASSMLELNKTGIYTGILFASSGTLYLSERALDKDDHGGMARWLFVTIALGATFMVGQGLEYYGLFQRGMGAATNLFATTFFTLTGFHGLHVTVGLVMLGIVLFRGLMGDFKRKKGEPHSRLLRTIGLYWHFVDVVWLAVFVIVYVRGSK
jgi:cytochrome c oxidase subunit 1/cytochrome c oxidase subunit I+III